MNVRFFIHTVSLLLALTSIEVNGQILNNDPNKTRPIGKLYDIGGYSLYLSSSGSGKPAVVLISGSLGFSFDWTLVQERLSKYTQTCSYDRPGLAMSDPGPMPRSLSQDVYELHKLLNAARIEPPYILVGHSIGGIIARKFANKYPAEVSGMVLVDATSENAMLDVKGKIERLRLLSSPEKKIAPVKEKVDTLTKVPSTADIEKLWSFIGKPSTDPPFDNLPVPIQQLRVWAQSLPKYYIADNWDSWAEEFAQMYSDSLSYGIGNKPLLVLCSTKNEYPHNLGETMRDSLMIDKIRNQKRYLRLSTNSKLITTAISGHEIFLTEPQLVVDAIRQIIKAIETRSKLN